MQLARLPFYLQEEAPLNSASKDWSRTDSSLNHGTTTGKPLSPSFVSSRTPKVPTTAPRQKSVEPFKQPGVEERLQNIKAYCRAMGLCFKRGDKWSPNHKCSTTISLNLVEELRQLLSEDEDHSHTEPAIHSSDSRVCQDCQNGRSPTPTFSNSAGGFR